MKHKISVGTGNKFMNSQTSDAGSNLSPHVHGDKANKDEQESRMIKGIPIRQFIDEVRK